MDSLFRDLENGLRVSFDWFSFTVLESPYCNSLKDSLELFGFVPSDFEDMPNGRNGYSSMMRLSGQEVYVCYNGAENMGIHFEVRGSSITEFLRYYSDSISFEGAFGKCVTEIGSSLVQEFTKTVLEYGKFSRIDLAVDNVGSVFYTPAEVKQLHTQQRIISRCRSFTYYEKTDSAAAVSGSTFYIGTRSSDIMLRIYDKQAEQNAKHPDTLITAPWVRWELECKGKKVGVIAQLLASGKSLGLLTMGVLSNYIRIIDIDNNNRSRCSANTKWEAFLCGIECLKLSIPEPEKSLEKSKLYMKYQYAPTLLSAVLEDGGSLDFVEEMLEDARKRLRPKHLAKLSPDAVQLLGGML